MNRSILLVLAVVLVFSPLREAAGSGYNDTIRCEEFPEVANFTVEQIEEELMR